MARRLSVYAVPAMTHRLVALHAHIQASDLAAGLAWYDRARQAAEGMAVSGDVERAASVIAHLSPRAKWATNVAWAARVLSAAEHGAECPPVSIGRQRRKAWAVATGGDPYANHGPKTRAFLANILGDCDRVCVDSWAARAATGRTSGRSGIGPVAYAKLEEAYRRAARIFGMRPRDFQAAVWVHVRGSAD